MANGERCDITVLIVNSILIVGMTVAPTMHCELDRKLTVKRKYTSVGTQPNTSSSGGRVAAWQPEGSQFHPGFLQS